MYVCVCVWRKKKFRKALVDTSPRVMFLYLGRLVLLLAAARSCASEEIPVVVPVITEAAEIYECAHSGDPAAANYTWFRQNSSSLPEGIKAEGNRLHFLQATSHLNGLYDCIVMNDKGTFVASLYRERQEGILEKVWKLWDLLYLKLSVLSLLL